MTVTNAKRIFFITDTHIGIRNGAEMWIEIQRKYFFEFFLPLVKKEYRPGDILVHLGDVYDSRQSINIKALNLCIDLFGELSKIFTDGIYVIIGNHDIWSKANNEINSLSSIKWIPNVRIFEEPETIFFGRKKIFLMPWRATEEDASELLADTDTHDYLFCHSDINGLSFNRNTKIEKGISSSKLENFQRVYSGHIHFSQNVGKIRMLGSPYQLTRSDSENKKSILLLDLETEEETLFENNVSPKFLKIDFLNLLEKTPDELNFIFNNNFVDVLIDPNLAVKSSLGILTDMVTSQISINFIPTKDKSDENKDIGETVFNLDGKNFSIIDFSEEFIEKMNESDSNKKKLKEEILSLYKKLNEKDN